MWRVGFALLSLVLFTGSLVAQDIQKAEELYNRTDYDGALAIARNADQGNGTTHFLLGRIYYMKGDFKKSSEHLETAVNSSPANSEYVDWLGRAYGKRAETSNPLSAAAWASKARQAFEKAVQLDPRNRDALDDLFDYYLDAPGILGGGYDKAFEVAQKLSAIDPGEGYYDQFKLDQKRKHFSSAEQHLRQAVAAAPHSVGHIVALAKFLANQGRIHESDALFAKAREVSPNDPRVWFARADILVKQKRNLEEAKELLNRYVHSSITADDPPREEALRLLKQVGGG